MLGYSGKILRVNLSNGEMATERPSEDYYRRYLGGRGFIIHTLLTEVPAGVDPLGPENKIVFALGPLSGQPLAGCGRNSIGAKSPMTGGFGETEVGGFFGAELRRAGYDAVIVEGVSKNPVYLNIRDGNAELRNASGLWGQEIAETERLIKEELGGGKIRTAIIGPGAERLVRYGIIANDVCHIAGRTGMGTVMGSKKLKAVVVRGHSFPQVADRQKIKELNPTHIIISPGPCTPLEAGISNDVIRYFASRIPIQVSASVTSVSVMSMVDRLSRHMSPRTASTPLYITMAELYIGDCLIRLRPDVTTLW